MRRLRSLRRLVPLDRLEDYDDAWEAVSRAAAESDVRAWRFRGHDREDHFMEFLEWSAPAGGDADGGLAPTVAAACEELGLQFGGAAVEDWDET